MTTTPDRMVLRDIRADADNVSTMPLAGRDQLIGAKRRSYSGESGLIR